MPPTRDSVQMERHTQSESEGMEKDIACKLRQKEGWGINTCIRQQTLKQAVTETKKDNT